MTDVSVSQSLALRPISITGQEQSPFASRQVVLTQAALIQLKWDANYWKAQHQQVCAREVKLKIALALKDAKIRDLKQRLFGKTSEKGARVRDQADLGLNEAPRPRGQQPGRRGHGRTQRADLPVVEEVRELTEEAACCTRCGLAYRSFPGTEDSEIFEVEVHAHKRLIKRRRYQKSCSCPHGSTAPGIMTAPVAARVIPKSPYGNSVWEQVLLGKFLYGQPLNRILQDLNGLGLPIAAGTLTGGLQRIAALFEPIYQALYRQQMSEDLFHNDESRWEVYEPVDGKVGHRWYLWVTRSHAVIYYQMDPSRSAAVPIAHFSELETEKAIVVCDRYSAYKKLARLNDRILLAFCWAHVRRDFLEVARGFPEHKDWGLDWVDGIGRLYHLNQQRLDVWEPAEPLARQNPAFQQAHAVLVAHLAHLNGQWRTGLDVDQADCTADIQASAQTSVLQKPLSRTQRKVLRSLQNHWDGLTRFVDDPHVPLDNNAAEQAIRNPVTGRKNYYGSGSIRSAALAAMAFSVFQTLGLWHLNARHWLRAYLQACADHGGRAPKEIRSFLPWTMDAARRKQLSQPPIDGS